MKHFHSSISPRFSTALLILVTLNACDEGSSSPSNATLSWITPTKNIDDSPLQELAGYYIYYGDSPALMTHAVQLRDPASTTFIVRHLDPGTHYFRLAAYSSTGAQSGLSSPVSKTIPRAE
jgi:hypothetical protein